MQPTRSIETKLQQIPPELRDIVLELRSLIAAIAPQVAEVPHSRGFSYYFAERGGPVSAGLCQIGIHPDHVRLGFVHGAFLPDPCGLLEGAPRYKRYVRIESFERAPWEALRDLIRASSRFDPYTLSIRPEPSSGSDQ